MKRYLFLDGLRGWAAMVVLLFHVFVQGLPPIAGIDWLEAWPPFNGLVAVCVFFIISGFALSIRYLETGDLAGWISIAAGRYFRLAIPIFATCLIVHLALVAGILIATADRMAIFRDWFLFDPTWTHLLRFSLFDVFFDYDYRESYAGPLWTMAPELAGSAMVLIATLVLRTVQFRGFVFLLIAAVLFAVSRFPGFFLIGMAAADFQLSGRTIPRWFGAALFAIGCAPLLFSYQWWGTVSAILIFVGAATSMREAFETPLSRWLGRISFPLYLVHGPVLNIVGEPLMRTASAVSYKLLIDIAVCALSIFGAILFAKLVNDPAIAIARRIGAAIARAVP